MRAWRIFVVVLVTILTTAPANAGPAATDSTYFDGFVDLTGVDPFRSLDVELDAMGGLRLKGNGASTPGTWSSAADFGTWITYKPSILIDNPLIPVSTLSETTVLDSLALPETPLAFRRTQPDPVLAPPPALSVDGYGVGGMSVVRVNLDYTYYMYYTGYPEDGFNGRIYLAKSNDGQSWTRVTTPVLELGEPGSFDSRQLGKPSVIYGAAGTPKFQMWYSAEGDLNGSIGYATSEDGLAWTKWIEPITVADSTGNVGQYASLAVGSDGLPIVAYYDATNADLKFVHCGNATCSSGNTVVVLDSTGDVGQYASLAVGSDGLPIIAYYDAGLGDLRVLHCGTPACTLGNIFSTVDGVSPVADVGRNSSIAVGPDGHPAIAYYDATNGDLKIAACNDLACAGGDETITAVDGAAGTDVGQYASLKFIATDPANPSLTTFPAVSYYDVTNGDLKLLVCNDALCAGGDETVATLDGLTSDAGQYSSLAIAAGLPVIAYYDATAGDLKVIACNDVFCAGGDDVPSTVDGTDADVGAYATLAIDASGLPVVAYYDATNGDLKLAACNDPFCAGGDEEITVVDGTDPPADVGQYASMVLGPGDLPLVAYYDAGGGDGNLKVAPAERKPREVLGPGLLGSIDSYTVSHPCVLYENGSFRMWYTANDSNNQRIAYATSTDGVTWVRGGLVIQLGNTANDSFGAWAPTVWKEGTEYRMVYTGWKPISGGAVVQSKLITAQSPDGTTWTTGNTALNPGNQSDFDGYNLFLPHVLVDSSAPTYKMWYVGNNPDANGNFHDRIGYATKSGTGGSWGKLAGPQDLGSVLGLGVQSAAFDSMFAADLWPSPVPGAAATLYGFYTGTNAVDFKARIGVKQSEDGGLTWLEVPGRTPGSPLIGTGTAGQFDEGGVSRPAPVDTGIQWAIYHTSFNASLAPAIGLHTVSHDLTTVTRRSTALISGGTDPAALLSNDGSTVFLYYASQSGGLWALRRASYDAANPGTQTAAPVALLFPKDTACWDRDRNGACDTTLEDLNRNRICEAREDLDASGTCTTINEDANLNGICDPGEDLNGDGVCTIINEDVNGDGYCVLADEDVNHDGLCDTFIEDTNGNGACTVDDCAAEAYDAGGMRQPLVLDDGGSWRLWYTAIGSDGVERIAYAESADGLNWTKKGLALDRSTVPYDFAEKGIRPAGLLANGTYQLFVTGVDRFGWRRSGLAEAAGAGYVDGGCATFQYPSDSVMSAPGYLPRDWRQIVWNPPAVPTGTGMEVWVSYYPTASDMWSNFFRIDNNRDLPFLLTVKGMRWQVRLTGAPDDAAVTPQLDDLAVDNADISFPASGQAATVPAGPPPGRYLLSWKDLTVSADLNGGTLTVAVEDQDGTPLLPAQPVTSAPLSLATLPGTSGRLILVFTLTPNTVPSPPETPLLKSINLTYESTDVPSSITLVATPATLYPGQETSVAGWLESRRLNPDGTESVTALPGQTVSLKRRAASEVTWTDLGTVTTGSDGSFLFPGPDSLTENSYYRAEWVGGIDVFSDGIIYPPAVGSALVEVKDPPLALTLASKPLAPITYGKAIVLSGTLSSSMGTLLPGQKVTLRKRQAGESVFSDFVPALVLKVSATGTFTTYGIRVIKPLVNTEYEVTWNGGDALGTGIIFPVSNTVLRVGVKPAMTLNLGNYLSRSGSWYLYRAGTTVKMAGKVTPNHYLLSEGTRGYVTARIFKQTLVDGVLTWVPYLESVRLLASSRATSAYSWGLKFSSKGKYRVQTIFPGDANHDPALTVYRNFRVY